VGDYTELFGSSKSGTTVTTNPLRMGMLPEPTPFSLIIVCPSIRLAFDLTKTSRLVQQGNSGEAAGI
jgi:hypothetical protein